MQYMCHRVASPLGWLECVASDTAVVEIRFVDESDVCGVTGAAASPVLADLDNQLQQYFAGRRRSFDVPLDASGTTFQRQVWEVLRTIPFGDTISYAEQARRLGSPTAVRAVGGANSRNPLPIVVPCHRVIGKSGRLVGYAGGLDRKSWLLDHERRVVGG